MSSGPGAESLHWSSWDSISFNAAEPDWQPAEEKAEKAQA